MGHVHVLPGDTIEIRGVQYILDARKSNDPLGVGRNDGDRFILRQQVLMCKGCGANEVDDDTDWGQFCPTCIMQAQRWVLVQSAMERHIPSNIRAVMEFDASEQARARHGSHQYIDLEAGAWDSITDPQDVEALQDVFSWVSEHIASKVS